MKLTNSLSTPLMAIIIFSIVSCGGQNTNKSTDTTATADTSNTTTSTPTAATTVTPALSKIVTTPQNMMVVRHKVANFSKWLLSYDGLDSMQLTNGIQKYAVGRGLTDSAMVQVTVKVDDLNKAKAYAKSPDLRHAMQRLGVVGSPMISFTTVNYLDTSKINSDFRSRTTFMVKDWDRWQQAFDSGRQVRLDNGLMDRVYGHDVDDDHKVYVVLALTDTAKAFAFFKSGEMKKRQAASGMIGTPERFVYRVVKLYYALL